MKVVVITDREILKELRDRLNAANVEFIHVHSAEEALKESADVYFDLGFVLDQNRIKILSQLLPRPVFVNAVTNTLDEIGYPFIRINGWSTFFNRELCEIAVQPGMEAESAKTFLETLQWKYQLVPDVHGMISARIIAMIINEAYFTNQENVSSRADIDTAMKSGTSYPYGPFEWAGLIGLKSIYDLLMALQKADSRYTISELLEKEAVS